MVCFRESSNSVFVSPMLFLLADLGRTRGEGAEIGDVLSGGVTVGLDEIG